MKLSPDDVRFLGRTVGLAIPDEDLANVTLRLEALFAAMERLEAELGEAMDQVEPIPPVFPREDF